MKQGEVLLTTVVITETDETHFNCLGKETKIRVGKNDLPA